MSLRGIRHLKREEVNATQLGIKNQTTSASEPQRRATLMKTSARSSCRTPIALLLSSRWICRCPEPGASLGHFKVDVILEPRRGLTFGDIMCINILLLKLSSCTCPGVVFFQPFLKQL
ncbi:hypothetical protein GOODEAATRI_006220 [Goodea atripinnis]|uniref:Uncharacterized protein n=1 Tax=Goodea atripinnis TaxID=208336 RepID=A0ABV0MPQ9_9TELE